MEPYFGPRKRFAAWLVFLLTFAGVACRSYGPVNATAAAGTDATDGPIPAATLKLTEIPPTLQKQPGAPPKNNVPSRTPTPTLAPEPTPTPRPTLEAIPLPKPGDRIVKGHLSCLYLDITEPGDYQVGKSSLQVTKTTGGFTDFRLDGGLLALRGASKNHVMTYHDDVPVEVSIEPGAVKKLAMLCEPDQAIETISREELAFEVESLLPVFPGEVTF